MRTFLAVAAFGLLSTVSAQAADLPSGYGTGDYFGNIYTAVTGYEIPSVSSDINTNYTLGGHFAYDPAMQGFGYQVDGLVRYGSATSDISWYQLTGHVTDIMANGMKVGAFVGYDKMQTASLGAEVLYSLSDATWVQAQVAVLDPTKTGELGWGVGGSINHHLTQNVSLRAEAAYNDYPTPGLSAYGAEIGMLYTFDETPVSVGLSAGYNRMITSAAVLDEYQVSLKLQYSFGGMAEGAQGKLFRTSVLGLDP